MSFRLSSSNELTVIDRAIGMVVGSAYGDALGARYEGLPFRISANRIRFGRGLLFWRRPGRWTDDTDMSLAILRVIERGTDLSSKQGELEVLEEWLKWYRLCPHIDMGLWTVRVLKRINSLEVITSDTARTIAASLCHGKHTGGGNGALMRSGVVAISKIGRPIEAYKIARSIASLTHRHTSALDAAGLWTVMCERAIFTGKIDLVELRRLNLPLVERLEMVKKAGNNGRRGWAVSTLLDAWWCVQSALADSSSLSLIDKTVRFAIAAGGDTDTVASVAGALAGALNGAAGVPDIARQIVYGGRWTGQEVTMIDLEKLVASCI